MREQRPGIPAERGAGLAGEGSHHHHPGRRADRSGEPPAFRGHGLTTDPWRAGLGLAVFSAGLGFAVWARVHIGRNCGRWHTTRIRGRSGMNDQVGLRLEVIPPLSRATAWIEMLAAGHSAQACATLPLRWQ